MEKIVDNVAETLTKTASEGSSALHDEFIKAQKNFLGKMPTPEQFKKIVDQLKDISVEEKEKLKNFIGDKAMNPEKLKEIFTKKTTYEATYLDYTVFIGMVLLVVVLFGKTEFLFINKVHEGYLIRAIAKTNLQSVAKRLATLTSSMEIENYIHPSILLN